MKRSFLVFVLMVTVLTGIAGLNIKIGPKIGYNASRLTTDLDTISSQFKSGFAIGAFARIGKTLYVQPELYYNTDGGVFSSNLTNWKQQVTMNNLNIPLLVGYSFLNKALNVRFMTGPMVAFAVNKTISDTEGDGGITGPIKESDLRDANWYLLFGGGADIWRFTFDIRYQIGLNKIIQDAGDYTFDSSGNAWVFSLGFKFF